jgi:2-C-methyl-D-erythritol 4-phosphate cytidylyltransferase
MGSSTPKQFLELLGKPILMHTLERFQQSLTEADIILALPIAEQERWASLCQQHQFNIPHQVVNGGQTRFHSVQNALAAVKEDSLVGIHDGVRPLVSSEVIHKCLLAAESSGAAIPTLPMVDSIRQLTAEGSQIADRNQFVLVQTPQCFQSNIILKAYQQSYDDSFTDDASVVEKLAHTIQLVEGNKENIKITTPEDLVLAKAYLSA